MILSLTALQQGSIKMLSNGEAHRPLVHCRDIAAAFMELCETTTSKVKDLVVNFGPFKMQIPSTPNGSGNSKSS